MKIVHQPSLIVPLVEYLRETPVTVGQDSEHSGVNVIVDIIERVVRGEIHTIDPGVRPVAVTLDDILFRQGEDVGELWAG